MVYRSDIEGLRALAVLAVVAYHMGVPLFAGGFTGVDVFFVISGYVIFGSVAASIEQGAFASGRFLKRRLYRIFPALFVVIIFTVLASFHILGPDELSDLAISAIAAIFSVSNIYFDDVAGNYFSANAENFPLLHTWSLGVEEQFYLLAPLLFLFASKKHSTKALIKPLIVIILISFLFNVYDTFVSGASNHAFYRPTHRFWEIGLGGCLAVLVRNVNSLAKFGHRYSMVLSSLGLAGILVSSVFISKSSSFPGIQALIPCLSTLLVLVSLNNSTIVARVLSSAPLTFLGRISFSIYLVHWPILVLYRLSTGKSSFTLWESVVFIGVVFILASLIWFCVENPIRRLGKQTRSHTALVFVIPVILSTVIFFWTHHSDGFPGRLSPMALEIYTKEEVSEPCPPLSNWQQKKADICGVISQTDGVIDVLLWGDSHAEMLRSKLIEKLSGYKLNFVSATMPDCPPLMDTYTSKRKNREACLALGDQIAAHLRDKKIRVMVLASRWATLASNINAPGDGLPSKALFSSDSGAPIRFSEAMNHTVNEITKAGASVLIIGPTPEIDFHVPKTLIRSFMNDFDVPQVSKEAFKMRQAMILDTLYEQEGRINVAVDFPHERLCRFQNCIVELNNMPLYYDDDHLNNDGVEFILDPIVERINSIIIEAAKSD